MAAKHPEHREDESPCRRLLCFLRWITAGPRSYYTAQPSAEAEKVVWVYFLTAFIRVSAHSEQSWSLSEGKDTPISHSQRCSEDTFGCQHKTLFGGRCCLSPISHPSLLKGFQEQQRSLLILFLLRSLDKNRHQTGGKWGGKGKVKSATEHCYLLGKMERLYSCCAAASLAQKNYITQSCKNTENQVH